MSQLVQSRAKDTVQTAHCALQSKCLNNAVPCFVSSNIVLVLRTCRFEILRSLKSSFLLQISPRTRQNWDITSMDMFTTNSSCWSALTTGHWGGFYNESRRIDFASGWHCSALCSSYFKVESTAVKVNCSKSSMAWKWKQRCQCRLAVFHRAVQCCCYCNSLLKDGLLVEQSNGNWLTQQRFQPSAIIGCVAICVHHNSWHICHTQYHMLCTSSCSMYSIPAHQQ